MINDNQGIDESSCGGSVIATGNAITVALQEHVDEADLLMRPDRKSITNGQVKRVLNKAAESYNKLTALAAKPREEKRRRRTQGGEHQTTLTASMDAGGTTPAKRAQSHEELQAIRFLRASNPKQRARRRHPDNCTCECCAGKAIGDNT